MACTMPKPRSQPILSAVRPGLPPPNTYVIDQSAEPEQPPEPIELEDGQYYGTAEVPKPVPLFKVRHVLILFSGQQTPFEAA